MHPLSNVYLWHFFRSCLETVFGLYSKRIAMLREMGFRGTESVLDVGCGTGEFAGITTGLYVGLDMDPHYIEFARQRHPGKEFRCTDVADLAKEGSSFECGLLVDVIHHLSDEQARGLIATLASLISGHLYVFEPVLQSSSNRIGQWVTAHDRGHYIRPRAEVMALIESAFVINSVRDMKILSVEGICVQGKPRSISVSRERS
jgi:2-polyprenyl-3-methyl-5-hydroxy-6-metoxy-1,4-benzoquinol methylase